ncbi:MAG: hypothetical protein RIS28_610 [Bacteroidota bacterium]
MGQAVCGIHNNGDLGLDFFGFSGDGLHRDELSTEVNHVGEVQHSRLRGDEFGIGLYDFKIGVRVFGYLGDFDDDSPSCRGLLESFNHGSVILIANDYLIVELPICAHDDGVEAFCCVSGECHFIGHETLESGECIASLFNCGGLCSSHEVTALGVDGVFALDVCRKRALRLVAEISVF